MSHSPVVPDMAWVSKFTRGSISHWDEIYLHRDEKFLEHEGVCTQSLPVA